MHKGAETPAALRDRAEQVRRHAKALWPHPAAEQLLAYAKGVFGELERAVIRERVHAGLDRARASGKTLGRPKVADAVETALRERLAAGMGVLKAAREVGVGTSVAQRVKAQMGG